MNVSEYYAGLAHHASASEVGMRALSKNTGLSQDLLRKLMRLYPNAKVDNKPLVDHKPLSRPAWEPQE